MSWLKSPVGIGALHAEDQQVDGNLRSLEPLNARDPALRTVRDTTIKTLESAQYLLQEAQSLKDAYSWNTSCQTLNSSSTSIAPKSAPLSTRVAANKSQVPFLDLTKWNISDSRNFHITLDHIRSCLEGLESLTELTKDLQPRAQRARLSTSASSRSVADDSPPPYSPAIRNRRQVEGGLAPQRPPRYQTSPNAPPPRPHRPSSVILRSATATPGLSAPPPLASRAPLTTKQNDLRASPRPDQVPPTDSLGRRASVDRVQISTNAPRRSDYSNISNISTVSNTSTYLTSVDYSVLSNRDTQFAPLVGLRPAPASHRRSHSLPISRFNPTLGAEAEPGDKSPDTAGIATVAVHSYIWNRIKGSGDFRYGIRVYYDDGTAIMLWRTYTDLVQLNEEVRKTVESSRAIGRSELKHLVLSQRVHARPMFLTSEELNAVQCWMTAILSLGSEIRETESVRDFFKVRIGDDA